MTRNRRRIFGLETEYGITVSAAGRADRFDADQAARLLFTPIHQQWGSVNVFWPNGGRVYLDVGSHPEYATAECDRLSDLLCHNRAGQQIFAYYVSEVNRRFAEHDDPQRMHLFRSNEDSQGHAFGCHENYLLRRTSDFRQLADTLVSFFVTRQILTGSGHVLVGEDGLARFGYSPRARHMDEVISNATTQARPIINLRDEPLAHGDRFRRLHVIVGDTNVSEAATALKVFTVDLLLGAIEAGVDFSDLQLADPMSAIRDIDGSLGGDLPVELRDGTSLPVSEFQWQMRQRILEGVDVGEFTDLEHYLADLWERGLAAVASGNYESVNTELDWAIKRRLFERECARRQVGLDDARIKRLDLAYHDVTDASGEPLFRVLEQCGLMRRLTCDEDVAAAMEFPPGSTRAYLRGQVVRRAVEAGVQVRVDWTTLHAQLPGVQPISLLDPFVSTDPRVDELLAQLELVSDSVGVIR